MAKRIVSIERQKHKRDDVDDVDIIQGKRRERVKEALLRIGRECAALPVQDERTADEILGFDVEERG